MAKLKVKKDEKELIIDYNVYESEAKKLYLKTKEKESIYHDRVIKKGVDFLKEKIQKENKETVSEITYCQAEIRNKKKVLVLRYKTQ